MRAVPITLKQANAYVKLLHRHNKELPVAKMAVAAVFDDGVVHGVAIAGAPKGRGADKPGVIEVSRVCTDGTRDCCSFLYGRLLRAAKALGYHRAITYTLESEPGSSLRASGWKPEAHLKARSWPEERGGSATHSSAEGKVRWAISLAPASPELVWPE